MFLRKQMEKMHSQSHDNDEIWYKVRHNGTIYLHVHVTQEGFSSNPQDMSYDPLRSIHQSNPMIRYAPHELAKNESYLMDPHFKKWGFSSESEIHSNDAEDHEEELLEGEDPALNADIISYWKPVRFFSSFSIHHLDTLCSIWPYASSLTTKSIHIAKFQRLCTSTYIS